MSSIKPNLKREYIEPIIKTEGKVQNTTEEINNNNNNNNNNKRIKTELTFGEQWKLKLQQQESKDKAELLSSIRKYLFETMRVQANIGYTSASFHKAILQQYIKLPKNKVWQLYHIRTLFEKCGFIIEETNTLGKCKFIFSWTHHMRNANLIEENDIIRELIAINVSLNNQSTFKQIAQKLGSYCLQNCDIKEKILIELSNLPPIINTTIEKIYYIDKSYYKRIYPELVNELKSQHLSISFTQGEDYIKLMILT